jgi:putative membrane protein
MEWGMIGYDAQWHGHPWVWIGHVLWFLLFAGLALAVAAALTRDRRQDFGGGKKPDDILDERYARGEIGRDEFLLRKRDLS